MTPQQVRDLAVKAIRLGRKHTAVAFLKLADQLEQQQREIADLQRKLALAKLPD